jgi:hypothetical protein
MPMRSERANGTMPARNGADIDLRHAIGRRRRATERRYST